MPDYIVEYRLLPYNPTSKSSILQWGQSLRGRTLREVGIQLGSLNETKPGDKGGFGKQLEIVAFRYLPNQDAGPDLPEAGIEIKSLPLVHDARAIGGFLPKERLVLHNANWFDIVNETWTDNSLKRKCSLMLVITDIYERDVSALDLVIKDAFLLEFPLPQDEPTIRKDWLYVQGMVRRGRAHEISAADTTFLDICQRGNGALTKQPYSDTPAKGRRFGLKRSYIRTVYEAMVTRGTLVSLPRDGEEANLSLEELTRKRTSCFIGRTAESLATEFGISTSAKDFASRLCDCMLGVGRGRRNDEFARAGYVRKSVSLEPSYVLAEGVSFPYIRIDSLLGEISWEESNFRSTISSRFCFMVWKKKTTKRVWQRDGHTGPVPRVFEGVVFVGIPDDVIDRDGYEVWEITRYAYAISHPHALPRASCGYRFHVRPHATKTQRNTVLPNGNKMNHQSFWIDARYVLELLNRGGYHIPDKLIDDERWEYP